MACAIIAEREAGSVLCDDHRATLWLKQILSVRIWQSIEDVLIEAAHRSFISEYDLDACETALRQNRYECRVGLKTEYLMQLLAKKP